MDDKKEVVVELFTSQIDNQHGSTERNTEMPVVQIVNEKGEQLPDVEVHKKRIELPSDKIVGAAFDDSGWNKKYEYANQQGQGQTPYYQQQQVAGAPVYVQGAAPPTDAARMGTYRRRNESDDYSRDSDIFGPSFADRAVRSRFVQRVYTILAVQLLYTCSFIACVIFIPEVLKFVRMNGIILIIAGVTELAIYFALVCCVSARRTFPLNFILLAIFTIAFAYIMAFVSATYSTLIVIVSMGITAGVCLLVSIFACQTSLDITTWGMYLCIIGIVVAIFGVIAILVTVLTGTKIMFLIYAGLIALVFALYLMYDTQMIMGGRRIELSPEEYIFGALCLYVDIMQIFWAILTIIGLTRS